MEVVEAINILATVLNTVTNSVAQASNISAVIRQAQTEGRTTLTDAEWATVQAANASSREALVAAIQKALAGG